MSLNQIISNKNKFYIEENLIVSASVGNNSKNLNVKFRTDGTGLITLLINDSVVVQGVGTDFIFSLPDRYKPNESTKTACSIVSDGTYQIGTIEVNKYGQCIGRKADMLASITTEFGYIEGAVIHYRL